MSFSFYGILTDPANAVYLDDIEDRLRQRIARDPIVCELVRVRRSETDESPYIRLIFRRNDRGDHGEWSAYIWLQRGQHIQQQNAAQVDHATNRCLSPEAVRNSDMRVRVLLSDDPGNEFTNPAIELLDFLGKLPGSIVFDPVQNEIVE